jgi:two-component system nitrate/nitrite response regulator NarL
MRWISALRLETQMHSPIRVAVFDTCPLYRMGVVQAIARSSQLLLVAEGSTAAEARGALRDKDPHVLLLNMGALEGLAAKQEIAHSGSQCKIAVLTARDDPLSVSKALAIGAAGYILKAVTAAELIQAIETLDAGKPFITPELASRLLTDARGGPLVTKDTKKRSSLSYREQQMLDHASQGLTNHEIAAKLGLKVSTIKHYMTNLYKKMQATNRLQAIQASQIGPAVRASDALANC